MVPTVHGIRVPKHDADTPEILECQVCAKPVDQTSDYLACDIAQARDSQRCDAYPASWAPLHVGCSGTSAFYCIELRDLEDARRILWWTAHLNSKSWTAFTDWDDFLAREGGYL